MSDEFQDIAVADATASAELAPSDDVASIDPATYVPETKPSNEEAIEINLKPGDNTLINNLQQEYNENNAPDRLNDGIALLTGKALAAREEEKEAKKSDAIQFFEDQQKRAEAHREFMSKEHEFGDMKMSGADLTKLMNFISNPAMQEKLRDRLGKSGVPKDKIDKGMKELNEYIELKKKEDEGKLTAQEQARLKEINESKEFKQVARAVEQQARDNGVELTSNKTQIVTLARTTDDNNVSRLASNKFQETHNNSVADASNNKKIAGDQEGMQAAYAHFSTAPHLGEEFAAKVAMTKPAPVANDVKPDLETATPAAIVAQAKPKVVVDLSFG